MNIDYKSDAQFVHLNPFNQFKSGFSLIEVLVSLVILSVVMIGVTIAFMNFTNQNYNNYMKSKAIMIAHEVADRARTNPHYFNNYVGMDISTSTGAISNCSNGSHCSQIDLYERDLAYFSYLANTIGGDITLKPVAGTVLYRVEVTWKQKSTLIAGILIDYPNTYTLDIAY